MIHLESLVGLAGAEGAARALLAACEAADGSASLSFEKSLDSHPDLPSWFLAREGGAGSPLVGLASVFCPRREEAEISAFVAPGARRRGVFSALLARLEEELAGSGYESELLVVERGSPGGAETAAAFGALLDFSEYELAHPGPEALTAALAGSGKALPQALALRRATEADFESLLGVYTEAFGESRENEESMLRSSLSSATRTQYAAWAGGRVVGAAALTDEGGSFSVNGVAVLGSERGKGYGKAIVARCLELVFARGSRAVIEVDSTNDIAYRTYLGLGFELKRAIDYWRGPFPSA